MPAPKFAPPAMDPDKDPHEESVTQVQTRRLEHRIGHLEHVLYAMGEDVFKLLKAVQPADSVRPVPTPAHLRTIY